MYTSIVLFQALSNYVITVTVLLSSVQSHQPTDNWPATSSQNIHLFNDKKSSRMLHIHTVCLSNLCRLYSPLFRAMISPWNLTYLSTFSCSTQFAPRVPRVTEYLNIIQCSIVLKVIFFFFLFRNLGTSIHAVLPTAITNQEMSHRY